MILSTVHDEHDLTSESDVISPRVSFLLNWLFAAGLLFFGLATIFWMFRIDRRNYSPAWFNDQWEMITFLVDRHGHPGIADFWSQHNEHRIIIQRLAGLADMFWFGNQGISLRIEIFAIQLLHLALFVYACRRWGQFSLSAFVALSGALAYCFFSPLQVENFDWGFQVTFVFVGLAATASIALLLITSEQLGSRQNWTLAATMVAAALTEMGNANGLLIWPILMAVAFGLRLSGGTQRTIGLCSLVGISVYLKGYKSPGYHSQPLDSLRVPGKLIKYVVSCLGFSWDSTLPNVTSVWPTVAESFSALSIVALLVIAIRIARRKGQPSRMLVFVTAVAMFFLGTIFMAASGRIKFGYAQATSSRYQSFALVYWACVALAVAFLIRKYGDVAKAVFSGVMLVLIVASVGRYKAIGANELAAKVRLDTAWNAFLAGDLNNPSLIYLYPDPNLIRQFYPYMIHYGLIPPPSPQPSAHPH